MIATPFQKPERYIHCPACGKGEHQVSHLAIGMKTAWYCDEDDCGYRFSLHVLSDTEIELVVLDERRIKKLVTLRSSAPVTLIVEASSYLPDKELADRDEYFYNEHTCPMNFMRNVVEIVDENGDRDPHGIFEYVKTEPYREIE